MWLMKIGFYDIWNILQESQRLSSDQHLIIISLLTSYQIHKIKIVIIVTFCNQTIWLEIFHFLQY